MVFITSHMRFVASWTQSPLRGFSKGHLWERNGTDCQLCSISSSSFPWLKPMSLVPAHSSSWIFVEISCFCTNSYGRMGSLEWTCIRPELYKVLTIRQVVFYFAVCKFRSLPLHNLSHNQIYSRQFTFLKLISYPLPCAVTWSHKFLWKV